MKTWDQAALTAKQEKRDYDRVLYWHDGRPYAFVAVRNGRAVRPQFIRPIR